MSGTPRKHLWQEAASFAARAHRHQIRKDERTPYLAHPVRVALTVALVFGCTDETVMAAALLHDVIEDTTVDYDDVLAHFGPEVAGLVAALSKDPRLVESEREPRYDKRLDKADWRARLIKLADVYDNFSDAAGEAAKLKLAEKARRAIRLAEDDPELSEPRRLLIELVESAGLSAASR